MKFRIIAIVILLVVLGGLAVLVSQDDSRPVPQSAPSSNPDDSALKGLRIN